MRHGFLELEQNGTNPNDFDMDTKRLPWYHIGVVEEIISAHLFVVSASLVWRFFVAFYRHNNRGMES